MTRIVVSGMAGTLPLAGVGLHYLQYCLGLRDLGVEVSYLEDGECWPYDPLQGMYAEDPSYTVAFLTDLFGAFDIPWAFQDAQRRYHGQTREEVHERLAGADLLLNVSGGVMPEDHHRRARRLVLVDTDPAFSQVAAVQGHDRHRRLIATHDLHVTFAERMGRADCAIPNAGVEWITTRQPVHLPLWEGDTVAPGATFTTVMNWTAYGGVEWNGERWGDKGAAFPLIRDLPERTGCSLELALAGDAPYEELRGDGWRVVDPLVPTRTIWVFREYIRASRGEVTVCKEGYVRSRSGWFSERSANYLACGRAVVTQDTGWTELLPHGEGLLAFSTAEEAEEALTSVDEDPVRHGRAAGRIAREHFDAREVLGRLLSDLAVD